MKFEEEGFGRYSDTGTYRVKLTPKEIATLSKGGRLTMWMEDGSKVVVTRVKEFPDPGGSR